MKQQHRRVTSLGTSFRESPNEYSAYIVFRQFYPINELNCFTSHLGLRVQESHVSLMQNPAFDEGVEALQE